MKKALFAGILASFFFAFTFILNRSMHLGGGSWVWSACLRYYFTLPILWAVLLFQGEGGLGRIFREIRRQPLTWLWWSTVGFGLFYAPLSLGSQYGEAWLTAATWQVTIVAGVLLTSAVRAPAVARAAAGLVDGDPGGHLCAPGQHCRRTPLRGTGSGPAAHSAGGGVLSAGQPQTHAVLSAGDFHPGTEDRHDPLFHALLAGAGRLGCGRCGPALRRTGDPVGGCGTLLGCGCHSALLLGHRSGAQKTPGSWRSSKPPSPAEWSFPCWAVSCRSVAHSPLPGALGLVGLCLIVGGMVGGSLSAGKQA